MNCDGNGGDDHAHGTGNGAGLGGGDGAGGYDDEEDANGVGPATRITPAQQTNEQSAQRQVRKSGRLLNL